MSDQDEYRGDDCIVLPRDYLNSAEAVAEIYDEELAAAATSFEVDELNRGRFFRGVLLVPLIWALSALWTVCI